MSDVILSFTIQGDSEGYVTFECPYCGSEFKLQAGEYQDEDISVDELFCPYCGLTKDPAEFWSADVREQVEILTENYMADLINEAFGKMKKSMNRKNGIIKMDFKPLKKKAEKDLSEKDSVCSQ